MSGTPVSSPSDVAREQLLPLVHGLAALAHEDGQSDQAAFFERIAAMLEVARDAEDLAGPFMELSTSAFRGYAFSIPSQLLLDRLLATAQQLSLTLSAHTDTPQ